MTTQRPQRKGEPRSTPEGHPRACPSGEDRKETKAPRRPSPKSGHPSHQPDHLSHHPSLEPPPTGNHPPRKGGENDRRNPDRHLGLALPTVARSLLPTRPGPEARARVPLAAD